MEYDICAHTQVYKQIDEEWEGGFHVFAVISDGKMVDILVVVKFEILNNIINVSAVSIIVWRHYIIFASWNSAVVKIYFTHINIYSFVI
jgi:hypothetical protein